MRPGSHSTYFLGLVTAAILPLIIDQGFGSNAYRVVTGIAAWNAGVNQVVLTTGVSATQSDSSVASDDSDPVQASRFIGTHSCVPCHRDGHSVPQYALAGKEYSVWVNRDPHSSAYSVLMNDRSKFIAQNLKLQIDPHKNRICLDCHSTNVTQDQWVGERQLSLSDGVGCETCHGGAEDWLTTHKLPDWKYFSAGEKSSLGFLNTDNVATRVRKCVECHVGSVGRDVNHDLVAAGHPRLQFEMSAYQSRMPRHWSRAKDLHQNSAVGETRLWLVGQLVSAAASLELLHQRASSPQSPWPEFTEYACISCHHGLAGEPSKSNDRLFANAVDQPAWGTWYFSTLASLAQTLDVAGASSLASEIRTLRESMQTRMPDREVIRTTTIALSRRLDDLADHFAQAKLNELAVLQVSDQLFAGKAEDEELNWDDLTQRYLAAVAFRQSVMDSRWKSGSPSVFEFEESKHRLIEIRDTLKFDARANHPPDLDVSQRTEISRILTAIFDQLKN